LHCGEWLDGIPRRRSSYDFGEKAFLMGLLSFCIPPLIVITLGLGLAALLRDRGDSIPWAIAGMVLGCVAVLGWIAYVVALVIFGH
jgi:hypothetical protein